MKGITVIIFFYGILLSGCSKKSSAENDNELPIITINTPSDNQVFSSGQNIVISGTITDNKYIAEVHIHVSNINTASLLMDVHLYPAGNSMNFNQSITAVAGINYKIQVIAKDKAVNQANASVNVSCN